LYELGFSEVLTLAQNHWEAKYRWEDNIKIGFMSPERRTKLY